MSDSPISSRNASASIFTVGCRSTNSAIAVDANSIANTAMTIAAIMIETYSAMPTAVITESSEKTMSSSRICRMTPANDAARRAVCAGRFPFEVVVNLAGALENQEQPAAREDHRPARELDTEQRHERPRQAHHPDDRQQQRDADEHREEQAHPPGALALAGGQLPRHDRDEDDVVDAEDDLQDGERQESGPSLGRGHPLHGRLRIWLVVGGWWF